MQYIHESNTLSVMLCAIWYHLYNLKNVKNTHGGVLLLVNFTKSNTPPWVFSGFLNCKNGNKSRKASEIKNSVPRNGNAFPIKKIITAAYRCSVTILQLNGELISSSF